MHKRMAETKTERLNGVFQRAGGGEKSADIITFPITSELKARAVCGVGAFRGCALKQKACPSR